MNETPAGGLAVEEQEGSPAPPTDVRPLVEFRECDVTEIVQEGAAEAGAAHPSVVVRVSMPPALRAVAEPAALRGVVAILVDAACRDTEAGSEVIVRGKRLAGITVHVTDRGSGLDRDAVGAEFERGASGGAVRGLALAKQLVALHGGTVWAEPLPAGGTKLAFTIPGKAPHLSPEDMEVALGALHALSKLAPEAAPDASGEDPLEIRELLDEAVDMAVAVTDGIAAEVTTLSTLSDPAPADEGVLSLADLAEVEPDALDLLVHVEPEEPPASEETVEAPPQLPDEAAIAAETLSDDTPMTPEESLLSLADLTEVDPRSVDLLGIDEEAQAAEEAGDDAPEAVEVPDERERPRVRRADPAKFIPDPLHPATAMLQELVEDYGRDSGWS